jgi:hypothetical protein
MTLEAIVCQYATQIGVTSKEDTKHVPRLSFIPVCSTEDRNTTWYRVRFASIGLDANPPRMLNAQQVVNHLEALLSFWEIDGGDIHDTFKLTLRMISKESQDRDDARWGDVQSEFIL